MKKLSFCLLALVSTSVIAADGSSGCGLGWRVAPKQSLLSSMTRNTTHVILPNTFSMTFGTSGCSQHSIVKKDRAVEHFVEANFENLQIEMAQGQGESLLALSELMGCDAGFASRAQNAPLAAAPNDIIAQGCL